MTDAFKGSFDEVFPLFADIVIDRRHRLNGAGSRTCKVELAIYDFALVQGKRAVSEDDKFAVFKFAGLIFVEIEDDFFVGKVVFGNFHKWNLA